MNQFDPFAEPARLECIHVGPWEIRAGDQVRLQPSGRADIMDLALEGKTATVEAIEQDFEGQIHLAVTVESDPGRDFGKSRLIAHRFYFKPEEVVPIDPHLIDPHLIEPH